MPTGIELSAGIVVGAAKPIDAKFGPYTTTATALADIPAALRYKGLTVGIETGGQVAEYWFRGGTTDADFVLKNPTSSFITGSGVASMQVVTALPATPSPTTLYIVIPSGATTASAVTLGSVSLLSGSGGGDPAFSPDSISGLQLWLDASDATTLFDATSGGSAVTADGAAVARWQDKSGNAEAIQATANQRPTFKQGVQNLKSILRFDGANDCLQIPSISLNTNITMFVVGKFFSTNPLWLEHDYGFYLSGTSTGWLFRRLTSVQSSGLPQNWFSGTLPAIATITYDGTAAQVRKNAVGLLNASVSGAAPINMIASAPLNIGSRGQLYMFSKGDLCEYLIYDGILSDQNRAQVESYLSTKWGIAL